MYLKKYSDCSVEVLNKKMEGKVAPALERRWRSGEDILTVFFIIVLH